MSDIIGGFSFSGSSPNDLATAGNLNALGAGTIQTTFFTGKPKKNTGVTGDLALLCSPTTGFYTVPAAILFAAGVAYAGASGVNVSSTDSATLQVAWTGATLRTTAGQSIFFSASTTVIAPLQNYRGGPQDGVSGRDYAGANMVAETWHYVFLISDGTNIAGMVSQCTGTPGVPDYFPDAAYIYYALIGMMKTDNTSPSPVPLSFYQVGREYEWAFFNGAGLGDATFEPYTLNAAGSPVNAMMDGQTSMGFTTAGTFQSIDVSRCAPPNANKVRMMLGSVVDHTGTNFFVASNAGSGFIATTSPPKVSGLQMLLLLNTPNSAFKWDSNTGSRNIGSMTCFEIAVVVPSTIYAASSAVSGITDLICRCTGFTIAP